MAENSDTLTVRMVRASGSDKETQWFEYRPAFNQEIVKVEWELDTMDVELDSGVADSLLRMGYATPIPEGSPPAKAPPPKPSPEKAVPAKKVAKEQPAEEAPPTPSAPSWLKPGGGK
jgi:hypothetical protein